MSDRSSGQKSHTGTIWNTGQYARGCKRNIESLAKYPTINYTTFSYNNMSKVFITKYYLVDLY